MFKGLVKEGLKLAELVVPTEGGGLPASRPFDSNLPTPKTDTAKSVMIDKLLKPSKKGKKPEAK